MRGHENWASFFLAMVLALLFCIYFARRGLAGDRDRVFTFRMPDL
jgi:hypothetical protein